jgi:hypothetical protein
MLGSDLLAFWDARYGITESGGLVSSWVDRKHGYDAVQATDAAKPTWDGEWVTGDGGDELTLAPLPSGIPSGSAPAWDWHAVDMLSGGGGQAIGSWGGASTVTGRRTITTSSGWFQSTVGTGAASVGATNTSANVLGRHVTCTKVGATETETVVDGVGMTPVAVVPGTGTNRLRFFAANATTAGNFANARIAARVITRPLSERNEALLTEWLMGRL